MPPRRRKASLPSPTQTNFADLLIDSPVHHGPADQVREAAPAAVPADGPLLPRAAAFMPFTDLVPVYGVKLVHLSSIALREPPPRIRSPRDVVNLLYKHFEGADREYFVVVLLDTKGGLIGVSTISTGDLASALVHPREVYKPAILANASSIILAHNHPSGDPAPSPEDTAVTRRLGEAGELLGIEVHDHVIIGGPNRWLSMTEKGFHTPSGKYNL